MARRRTTKGVCMACRSEVTKSKMGEHLKRCERRREKWLLRPTGRGKVRKVQLLQLLISGRYAPEYWIYVEIPSDAPLLSLDLFLRAYWLECCGHLSQFRLEVVDPLSRRRFPEEIPFPVRIDAAFSVGGPVYYSYDFGSTTELELHAVDLRDAEWRDNRARVLARNLPPKILCHMCDNPAAFVEAELGFMPDAWVCEEHAKRLGDREEILLPVVNSPRVGVCAYEGQLPHIGPALWLE